jgi:hypothetical protein
MDIPEDLTTLDDDQLAALEEQLVAEFDRLNEDGSRDLAELTRLADGIDAVRAESSGRTEAVEREQAEVAALAERVHGNAETPEEPEPDETPEEPEPTEEETEAENTVLEPVAASAQQRRRPSARAVAGRSTRPAVAAPTLPVVITAAADLPGIPVGRHLTTTQIAQAFHDKARGLSDHSARVPIARINVPIPAEHRLTDSLERNAEIVEALIGHPNAASLVASGGWCVPSRPLMDLFEIADADGLIDLPSVGTINGGVLVPSYFDQSDADGALWTWTEADDISSVDGDPTKPCLRVPCPTWTDKRAVAEGLCVTAGNLQDRAFPALTRHFVNLVMAAHQHRMSAAKIASITAGATAVAFAGENSDAAGDLLSAVGLQAADLRSQFRASRTRSVDTLLPDWTIEMLRANVAKRAGVDLLSVTDAQVIGWLTARGIRPQFLTDYQPLYGTGPATDWPATLKFTTFFSGAYLVGDGGEIDLGVVRDSVLNSTNDFTAAWSEQFYLVAQVGPTAREVTVDLDVDGVTACCATATP